MLDILIQNGSIIDGTGKKAYIAVSYTHLTLPTIA